MILGLTEAMFTLWVTMATVAALWVGLDVYERGYPKRDVAYMAMATLVFPFTAFLYLAKRKHY